MAKTRYRVLARDAETGHWIAVGIAEGNSPRQAVDTVAEEASLADIFVGIRPGSVSAWAGVPESNWSEFEVELPERPALKTTPRDSSPTALGLLPREAAGEVSDTTEQVSSLSVVPPLDNESPEADETAEAGDVS